MRLWRALVANPKYRPHPLVEKLTSGSGDSGATKVLGYFGGTTDGVVKVYLSLDDLGEYYEIREEDIIHLYTTERTYDAIAQGELRELGLSRKFVLEAMVQNVISSLT